MQAMRLLGVGQAAAQSSRPARRSQCHPRTKGSRAGFDTPVGRVPERGGGGGGEGRWGRWRWGGGGGGEGGGGGGGGSGGGGGGGVGFGGGGLHKGRRGGGL